MDELTPEQRQILADTLRKQKEGESMQMWVQEKKNRKQNQDKFLKEDLENARPEEVPLKNAKGFSWG